MSNKFCIKKNFFVFLVLIILVGVYFVFSNKLAQDKKSLSTSAALRKQTTPPPTTPVLKTMAKNSQISKAVYLTDNFVSTVREEFCSGNNCDNADKIINNVKLATKNYFDKLSCAQPGVTIDYEDLTSKTKILDEDSTLHVMATTPEPGIVKIDVRYVFDQIEKTTDASREFKRIIYHEMTHACKPDSETPFDQSFFLLEGTIDQSEAYAMHGLGIIVNINGEKTKFLSIEEGVAEAIANYLYSDYDTSDPSYFRVGQLTIAIINEWKARDNDLSDLEIYQELAKFVQTNNLIGCIQKFMGKETAPTYSDIKQFVSWYFEARNNIRPLDEIKSDIANYIGLDN